MTNRIAVVVASLQVGEIVVLKQAHKRPGTGERVEETRRAVVRWVERDPRPNWRGVPVVGFGYSPAWNEPAWCGHGTTWHAVDGAEPQWAVYGIERTGESERPMPAAFTPRPGDRAYDLMC